MYLLALKVLIKKNKMNIKMKVKMIIKMKNTMIVFFLLINYKL